jgi:hypothetical protein
VSGPAEGPSDLFVDDPLVRETLELEHRLRDNGYSSLPHVLALGGDFDFDGLSVDEIVTEARRLLAHQHAVELSGARILASIGELAVKAAAFDAVLELYRDRSSPPPTAG